MWKLVYQCTLDLILCILEYVSPPSFVCLCLCVCVRTSVGMGMVYFYWVKVCSQGEHVSVTSSLNSIYLLCIFYTLIF